MNEELLHFIWKYRLIHGNLLTDQGEPLEIIKTGLHNQDAGPDFSHAQIKIGDTLWAGHVEIHINASDWFHHNHHEDLAYKNVILHVVLQNDLEHELHCPSFTLAAYLNTDVIESYRHLMLSKLWIPCSNQLMEIDQMTRLTWQSRLLINRLERRTEQIQKLLDRNENSWAESFYQHLARSFGFKVNSDAFEHLAINTPLKYFSWHKQQILQIEALLFGQSGLLNATNQDEYPSILWKEYQFLKRKYNLISIHKPEWKFARMRPSNFPTIRISQFASLLASSSSLFSQLIEAETLEKIQKFFTPAASYYWADHFQFNKKASKKLRKNMGQYSINILLINTVIPFIFAYGQDKNNQELIDRAVHFMESLPAEKNSITEKMTDLGFKNTNAGDSQALIELKNEFCASKKCLSCAIGTGILRKGKS